MSIVDSMTNVQKLNFGPQSVLEGGESMRNGQSLQDQIANAPLAAFHVPTISGWADGNGKPYSTSIADQLKFGALADARQEAQLGAIWELLQQVVNAVSKGVDVAIDYDRIESAIKDNMPSYEITPKEKK